MSTTKAFQKHHSCFSNTYNKNTVEKCSFGAIFNNFWVFVLQCGLAILPTILLLFPNPYMPTGVRLTHFVEVFLSNGLFGLILGFVLTMKNKTSAQKAV